MPNSTQPAKSTKPVKATTNGGRRKRRLLSLFKRLVLALVVAAAVWVVYLAYRPKPVPVDLAKSSRGPVEVLVEEDGRTRVKDRYLVTAPLTAKLQRIALRAGDSVEPGQELAQLLPIASPLLDARSRAEAQARVDAARAARLQAEATVKRMRTALSFATKTAQRKQALADKGTVSSVALENAQLEMETQSEELASAEFGARVAAHQLELAKVTLEGGIHRDGAHADALVLTSPVGGRVLSVQNQSEGIVQPGAPLIELGDCRALEVVIDVLTSDAVQLRPGAEARILRWGGEQTLQGHVRLIEPSAFTRMSALGVEEQRVNVIVDLDTPQEIWNALGDGYRVEAQLLVTRVEDALRIPESVVFRHDSGWAAFTVIDGLAQLRSFVPGQRNAQWVQVQSGIRQGEQLVLHPSDNVADGVVVEQRH